MSFKDISYLELCCPFVHWSEPIGAHLVEGIMRNISVKLFCFWAIAFNTGAQLLHNDFLDFRLPVFMKQFG